MYQSGFENKSLTIAQRGIIVFGIFKVLIITSLIVVLIGYAGFRYWQAEKMPQGDTDLEFTQIDLPFVHKADLENSLPFLGSAAIDINNDGQDELFLGGGKNQADKMFAFRNGNFEALPITFAKETDDATHGAASIDIDNDGDTDLFTARESGVWLHRNDGGTFISEKLNLDLADNTTPLSIGFGDINRDGFADMYIAGYLKIELVEGQTIFADNYGGYSHLFLNWGTAGFEDVSMQTGIWRQHNTFSGIFADLDNDHDSDLIIAQDTGVVEIYRNMIDETGTLTFVPIPNPSVNSYPMGVAIGDYDNNGFLDLYFSNVGYTMPPFLLRGDLKKDDPFNIDYMLYRNNQNLSFSDETKAMKAARFGFGWGSVFADINLDGREDIVAAQNYARLPAQFLLAKYPGKILQNYGTQFQPVEKKAKAVNKHYGISPIISDFNADGWPDLVWANLNGPSTAFLNKGGTRQWIKVRLPNTAASLNAIVTVVTDKKPDQTKQIISSQGLGSDQGRDLVFGIPEGESIISVSVEFQNGTIREFNNPSPGSLILTAP